MTERDDRPPRPAHPLGPRVVRAVPDRSGCGSSSWSTSSSSGWTRDPRLRFTLDGQAATVDDYLEVRPEAEPLIRRLIAEGRLAIGPWQILMDEFLVSGETIVRNLEFGWARAEALGGAMPVGYLPDMFGHIAQMPQILRRAGIERAVVWRGVPAAIDRNTLPLGRARRLGGRDRVPGRRLRQRRLPVRRPGPPRLEARPATAIDNAAVLRRALAAGDVRHRPRRPLAPAGRPRRRGQRARTAASRSGSRRWPTTRRRPETGRPAAPSAGPASCARARGRTC